MDTRTEALDRLISTADTIDEEFFKEFQDRLLEAAKSKDIDTAIALLADDVVKSAPYPPGRWEGKEAVRGEFEAVLGPSGAFSIMEIEPIGERYLSLDRKSGGGHYRWTVRMTGPLDPPGFAPTDGVVHFESAEFWWFRDGLVIRWDVVSDLLDVGRQIGAVPEPGSGADRMGLFIQRMKARQIRRRERAG